MLKDFSYQLYNDCDKSARAGYKITTSCPGKICMHDVVCESGGALFLVPGSVTDVSRLVCHYPAADITLPVCENNIIEKQAVSVEEPCQIICDDTAGGICDSGCIWTSTDKQASTSSAHVGDSITYTVTFTNHSYVLLDMVCISDDIPAGVTVIPNSIHPAPKPNETLQTGISMGSLPAGQTAVLSYSVTVDAGTSGDIVNCACVRYCYTDCAGCCQHGVGSCKSSTVKIMPADIRIEILKSANKKSVCNRCEEIAYTLTVSNPGKVAFDEVVVYDRIPQGLCYKTGSTVRNGRNPTDENPQSGIFIGNLEPGEIYTITFVLLVCIEPCCTHPSTEFVNTAIVRGKAGEYVVSAESDPWVIMMNGRCFCQNTSSCFSICDFDCFRYYYIYHTDVTYININCECIISAGYGITIKYIDCNGVKKSKSFESNVIFNNLPNDFDPDHFTVCFTNLVCDIDCCGNIFTKFKAMLCYCVDN